MRVVHCCSDCFDLVGATSSPPASALHGSSPCGTRGPAVRAPAPCHRSLRDQPLNIHGFLPLMTGTGEIFVAMARLPSQISQKLQAASALEVNRGGRMANDWPPLLCVHTDDLGFARQEVRPKQAGRHKRCASTLRRARIGNLACHQICPNVAKPHTPTILSLYEAAAVTRARASSSCSLLYVENCGLNVLNGT